MYQMDGDHNLKYLVTEYEWDKGGKMKDIYQNHVHRRIREMSYHIFQEYITS